MVNLRVMGLVAALAAGAAAGWSARGVVAERALAQERAAAAQHAAALRDDVARLERERAEVARAQAQALRQAQQEAARWRDAARQAERGLERSRADLARAREGLLREVDRAELDDGARCSLGARWVRLYDEALRAAGGGGGGATGSSAGGADAAGADAAPAVGEWEVMRVHADNAARWGECLAQLRALQDWVRAVAPGGE